MKSIAILLLGAAGLLAVAARAEPDTTGTTVARPNIVYILADDLGPGDVSALNPQAAWRTPNLDRLAREGRTFTDAHSASAVCTPSRYAILTGRYPWRTILKARVLNGYSPALIESGRLTVAELLRRAGYRTAAIGKWHLGLDWAKRGPEPEAVDFEQPMARGPVQAGFDYFHGISASLDMPPYVYIENDRVVSPPAHSVALSPKPAFYRAGPTADGFSHEQVLPHLTKKAVDHIDRVADDRAHPFFLYVPLTAPHTPIMPGEAWAGKSGVNAYGDFVLATDDAVGRILAALDRRGLAGNTLVVFTSDNGCSPFADFETLGRHGHDSSNGYRGAKADIYEGGHRIPFIARWPGHVEPGSRSDALVSQTDLLATCAELVGATLPADAGEDSVSMLALLGADAGRGRDSLIVASVNGSLAIRRGDWKLCACPDSGGWSDPRPGQAPEGLPPFQLFDLRNDPGETRNLATERPDKLEELGRLLFEHVANGRSTPGSPHPLTLDDFHAEIQPVKVFAPGGSD